jgi:hypothetical protein
MLCGRSYSGVPWDERAAVVLYFHTDRKSARYGSMRDDHTPLRERLRAFANQRCPFGYRRRHIPLRREGMMINRKKNQRIYREEGLAVRRRCSRTRAMGARAPAPVLTLPNQRWSLTLCMIRWRQAGGSACSTWLLT